MRSCSYLANASENFPVFRKSSAGSAKVNTAWFRRRKLNKTDLLDTAPSNLGIFFDYTLEGSAGFSQNGAPALAGIRGARTLVRAYFSSTNSLPRNDTVWPGFIS